MQNQHLKPITMWHKAPEIFAACSEASNIGIVINIISKWVPEIMKIGHGVLGGISHYADVLIYVFKALIRLTKLTGRYFFNIQFDDEDKRYCPKKMFCDALSLVNFSLAILSFASVIASGPVAITLGWTFGLVGLGIVGYSDYYLSKKQSKNEFDQFYQDYLNGPDIHIFELLTKYQDYKSKNYEFKLYVGLMVGLTFLLVFGSSALFAPAGVAAILTIISKIASVYLAGIAVFRFSNWIKSKLNDHPLKKQIIETAFQEYQALHANENREQLLLGFTQANKISFFPSVPKKQVQSAPALAITNDLASDHMSLLPST